MKLTREQAQEELTSIAWDDLLNRAQKKTFIRDTLSDLLREMTHSELEEIQSAIRMAEWK